MQRGVIASYISWYKRMTISMSLLDDDVTFLDTYAAGKGLPSRSATLHRAVRLLRATGLGADYDAAWVEWSHGDELLWDQSTSDGVMECDGARSTA